MAGWKDWTTDGSTVYANSREGCVTKCGANFLTALLWQSAIRKKPSQTCAHFCLYIYSSGRYILSKETHRVLQRSDTFNTQFPKLTTICGKFSCFEGDVTKYCGYTSRVIHVMLDTIGHVAKYSRTCIRDSSTVFAMRNILGSRDLGRGSWVPNTSSKPTKPMRDTLTK